MEQTRRNFFVALDGPDGGGKGTQVALLVKAMVAGGLPVLQTREAGGTELGRALRGLILDTDMMHRDGEMDALTSAYLFMADRRHNVRQNILPALAKGQWVVADRYGLATAIYQGYGLGGDVDMIYGMLKQATIIPPATQPLMADLYLILDVAPAEGMRRKKAQAGHVLDRLEEKGIELQQRVREGYLNFAKHPDFASRTVVLDSSLPLVDVHEQIIATINQRLGCALQPLRVEEAGA